MEYILCEHSQHPNVVNTSCRGGLRLQGGGSYGNTNKLFQSCSEVHQKHIFTKFRKPRVIISDAGMDFINNSIHKILANYKVHHKGVTNCNPKNTGHVEESNREVK